MMAFFFSWIFVLIVLLTFMFCRIERRVRIVQEDIAKLHEMVRQLLRDDTGA